MFKIKNTIFKVFIELFILNKDKRAQLKAQWAKKHLQKYVDIAIKEPFKPIINKKNNIIWQYWHQGIENAPEVIRKCLNSIKRVENDKTINVLTFDTIKNYIELPQRYYDLVNSGKMPIALFSDLLRVYLLEKYGGTWIDATIYLSEKIPQDILNSDFFALQNPPTLKSFTGNKAVCYFLHAKAQSANIQAIKRSLDAYWAENDFMFNYFMFEHIETILMNKTDETKAEWDKMPYFERIDSGLNLIKYSKYDEKKLNETLYKSWYHKLTYKKYKNEIFDDVEDRIINHL